MESTFVWILMFAGAAVALLGIFLVASERELKTKRREIEGLLTRLEKQPQTSSAEGSAQISDQASTDLLARNRELENEIRTLSGELTQSRKAIEALQAAQDEDGEAQDRIRRLSGANEQLAREAEELRSRLAAGAAELQSARVEDGAPALSRMEAEIEELRRALQTSHARATELEEARRNLPDPHVLAAEREAERQGLQAEIADLEKRLAEQRQELAERETLRERIAESENIQEALRAEISRYEDEVPRWQARIAAAEESARRLTALQAPYHELLARHADLADRQRQLQEELAGFARQIAAPERSDVANSETIGAASSEDGGAMADSAAQGSPSPKLVPFEDRATSLGVAPTQEPAASAATDPRTHRFGVLGALLFIGATGIAGFQFLDSEWEQPSAEIVTAQAPEETPPTMPHAPALLNQSETAAEQAAVPVAFATEPTKPAPRESETVAARTARPAAAQVTSTGTYKVIQPSRVYAAPNESSRPLGDIEPGVNVNVVDARDGWLEIHSKHGRPPGFIRREVAARVASAN